MRPVEDWELAGTLLLLAGEVVQAMNVSREGLSLNPRHVACRYNLATGLFQCGDVSAAVRIFEQIACETGDRRAWQTLASVIPGCPQSDHQRVLDIHRPSVERQLVFDEHSS
jgi:predicted Zn-dependent protease